MKLFPLAIVAATLAAGTARADVSQDSAPPAGRSLFDYLMANPSSAGLSLADANDADALSAAAWGVIVKDCKTSGCHAKWKDLKWIVENQRVKPGDVGGSKLVARVVDIQDMPQNAAGDVVPMPPGDLDAIKAWIAAGAPVPGVGGTGSGGTGGGTMPPPPGGSGGGGNATGDSGSTTPPGPDGSDLVPATVDVPFPFERLVEKLAQRAQGTVGGTPVLPAMVLIPNGRSLQRDHTNAPNPRVVAAFTDHPAVNNDVAVSIRDRVFLGYAAQANQLEVISYNEQAGRFEFQIVTDYREGGKKQVLYANRGFCIECHKAKGPIFSKNTWDETNANLGVATVIEKSIDTAIQGAAGGIAGVLPQAGDDKCPSQARFFNVVCARGNKGLSYAVDTSTIRAARLPAVSRFWAEGCKGASGNLTPDACRAGVFFYGLLASQGLDGDAISGMPSYEEILKAWKAANLSTAFSLGRLENRNPTDFQDFQMFQMEDEQARINLWKKNLAQATIKSEHDPRTTPASPYAYSPGGDAMKEALDLTIGAISGMITPSERAALPQDAAKLAAGVKAALAAGGDAFGFFPLRKRNVMLPVYKSLGITTLAGQPMQATGVSYQLGAPLLDVNNAAAGGALFTVVDLCGTSCHAVPGFVSPEGKKIDFLVREGLSDKDLWLKIVKTEKAEFCRRVDLNDGTLIAGGKDMRMPRPSTAAFKRIKDDEKLKGTSDRKTLMDAYRDKLLEVAGDPSAVQTVGASPEELKAMAAKCVWTKYTGN